MLAPAELVRRAAANGVTVLALTDHDELAGLAQAADAARADGIRFVPGVEISVTWAEITIHIVGLGIDPANADSRRAPGCICGRAAGAGQSASPPSSTRSGSRGRSQGAYGYAENPKLIGRAHFARFLVDCGVARDVASVFRHYLVRGKPGYVPQQWADLAEAVAWIRASGGRAVVAHPGRYKLSRDELRRFLAEFKAAGGEGHRGGDRQPLARPVRRRSRASRASSISSPRAARTSTAPRRATSTSGGCRRCRRT